MDCWLIDLFEDQNAWFMLKYVMPVCCSISPYSFVVSEDLKTDVDSQVSH